MIADCAESASRSLTHPNLANLRNLIGTVVETRIEDGQFNNCDITLREMRLVVERLAKDLSAIYHSRVSYPSEEALPLLPEVPLPTQPVIPPKE